MPEWEEILSNTIAVSESDHYEIAVHGMISEDPEGFRVKFSMQNAGAEHADVCLVEFTCRISNPIDPVSIGVAAASAYAACVGFKSFWTLYDLGEQSYGESKKKNIEGLRARVADAFRGFKSKRSAMLAALKKHLKDCAGQLLRKPPGLPKHDDPPGLPPPEEGKPDQDGDAG
jgi:hypothetical protein